MRFSHVAILALALAIASPAAAQSPHPTCTAAGNGGNACQLAVDLFQYMNPQLGMLIAGGNATLGQGGAMGGLGKFAITLRANLTQDLTVPKIEDVDVSGGVTQGSYLTEQNFGGFPAVDVAVGLWGGMPMGLTRVGGIDAIVNIFYIPGGLVGGMEGDDFSVSLPDGGTRLGFGVRVGVIQESAVLPGVALTYLQRNLPKLSFSGQSEGSGGTPDTISVQGLEVKTSAWRLVAGKGFGPIRVAAGYGQDRYSTSATLGWVVHEVGANSGDLAFSQNLTRSNMFADLSFNLFLFRVVGEIGRVSGGNIQTYNEFDSDPAKARVYGAVGLRFGN